MPLLAPARAGTILDYATATGSAGTSATTQNSVSGTLFPLLRNRIYRVYNLSAVITGDDTSSDLILLNASIQISFLDNQGNNVLAEIPAVGQAWASTVLTASGIAISQSGDPLMAFKSGFLITGGGVTGIPGFFQVGAAWDVENTSSITAHSPLMTLAMLFDDYASS